MTLRDDNSYPPRNLVSDEDILKYISEHQIAHLHRQGFEWFWSIYMPALERAAKSGSISKGILADNYYVAGDVHEFNESPRTAITYYEKALKFDPDLNAAHREISRMYHRLGCLDAAIRHSDLALAIWPDEKHALADRVDLDEDVKSKDPYFENCDTPSAHALDALAQNKPQHAINILEGLTDKDALRALTWAYGAKGDVSAYLQTWRFLVLQLEEIWFSYRDWFFMPEDAWYEPEIWSIWLKGVSSYTGVFIVYPGLDDPLSNTPTDKNFSALTESEKISQKIQYIYFCQSENLEGLKAIEKNYPNWVELREKIELMSDR